MTVGYVRLSRDDDKRNYVSIENQKLILTQYASENGYEIDRWYEDDGVSGYLFDRPGFNQLMRDLDKDVNRVLVKDFSRLGRHNAKLLLLLDEFQERGKHLIAVDDDYDSLNPNDDIIGIKTWYNERYVKDASKKIKRVIGSRQKEGTLVVQPPFGYKWGEKEKSKYEIVSKEAEYIKLVYDLYIKGYGYRRVADYLTGIGAPTPSMIRHERELEEGRVTKHLIAQEWSDGMVKDLLGNDFYIGNLRLHKRARVTIHGKDKRVPREEQYVFENHHPAIIDKASYELVQDIKTKRIKHNYRGSKGQWTTTEIPNPFGSCLYCKECGNRLTPIRRKSGNGERKYYVCITYNTKGRRYCSKAHLIEEDDLMDDLIMYLKLCRNSLGTIIESYNISEIDEERKGIEEKRADIQKELEERKKRLKVLFSQKIKDLANAQGNEEIINSSYEELQKEVLEQISKFESQLVRLEETDLDTTNVKGKLQNALQILNRIIDKGVLDRKDIEILVERIVVDEDGLPEIELKYGLSGLLKYSPAKVMNKHEHEMIIQIMQLIAEDDRGYTSLKYLLRRLEDIGFSKSKRNLLPYIKLMVELDVLKLTDNSMKPYSINKTKEEIKRFMEKLRDESCSDTGYMTEYVHYLHSYGANRWHASDGI